MNDEWCRCPICYEDYSTIHRPTTFACGHSTCIDHVICGEPLQQCPICRNPLRRGHEYHVSYSLEEGSRLFQLIKNRIDLSTITVRSVLDDEEEKKDSLRTNICERICVSQLESEVNLDTTSNSSQRMQNSAEIQTLTRQQVRSNSAVLRRNQYTGYEKQCGHRCDLVTTRQCCSCSDKRPHIQPGTYQRYVDGCGIVNRAARNQYYCTNCKRQKY